MKKTILALRPVLPDEMAELDSHFNVLKLWEEKEPEEESESESPVLAALVAAASLIVRFF